MVFSGHLKWRQSLFWHRARSNNEQQSELKMLRGGIGTLKCSWEDWSDSPDASIVEQNGLRRSQTRRTQNSGVQNIAKDKSISYSLDELVSNLSKNVVRILLLSCVYTSVQY
jgi:hypothetical protein